MNTDAGGVGVGRRAGVEARIALAGLLDQQAAGGDEALLGDEADAAPGRVEVDHLRVLRPGDVGGRLRGVLDYAGQVDGGAHVDEELGAAQNLRDRFWKEMSVEII